MSESNTKLVKTTFFLTVFMFLAKVISFLRDLCLSYKYGATFISDAYLVAVSVPTVLFSGIVTALFTCYIPVYNEIKKDRPAYVKKFNSNVISVVLLLSIVIVILYWGFSEKFMLIFAAGFEDSTFQLAKDMSNIMVLAMVFMGVSYVFQGYLQANGGYYLIGLMTIPTNVIMAIAILLSSEQTINIMVWGTVIAYAVYIPYFGIPAYKKGFRCYPYLNLKDETLKKLFFMILPIFAGQMILEINVIVDKNLASGLTEGTITAMDYAHKVSALIYATVVAPISSVVYPKFSKFIVNKETQDLKKLLTLCLTAVAVAIVPIVVGMCILAEPVIEILFFRGAFSKQAVEQTVECLICYNLGVVPIGFRIILEKVFYSQQETKIPMINSIVGIIVNIVLDIILVTCFEHCGLAVATSIASWVICSLFYLKLRKRIGSFGGKYILLATIKVLFASAGMGVVVWLFNVHILAFMNTNAWLIIGRLLICTLVGVTVYIILLYILRLNELNMIKQYIRKKNRR